MLKRWKLVIEYLGTGYAGWQWQEGLPTIQQSIEEAIYKFCQKEIRVFVAGRTDAGVHARGQVAHFDLDYGERELTGFILAKALNAHLKPQPISIVHAEVVDSEFHARFGAKEKLYTYRVILRNAVPALDVNRAWYFYRDLNVEAMREASKYLLGKHDFSTFRDSQCQAKSPIKTLDSIEIIEQQYDDFGGKELLFNLRGRSFLHHQVRNIVGTLVLVGEGKWQPEDIKTALEAKDRRCGGPTAPAEGLYLMKIDYK